LLHDEVLHVLEKRKGHIVTGGQLAKTLNVSRTAIWKSINTLKDNGKEIVSVPNVGYKLLSNDDTLSKQLIDMKLSTAFLGRSMELLSTVNSTNQYLKEINVENIDNGYVVISDEQTSGRGRRSRTFISNKGEGIYLSILLKLNKTKLDIRLFTICAAVAVSKAIENICNIRANIKWVNDIFCNDKKICGILTEAIISGELQELDTIIIGIGINTGNVSVEIKELATSIQYETGLCGIRNDLIAEVLNQFETVYFDYTEREKKKDIINYYESRLFIIGQEICVIEQNNNYPVTVIGVDNDGALIVKNSIGETQNITTGEIKLNETRSKVK